MKIWDFAMAHPYITTIMFIAAIGSGYGVGVSFAKNKTPDIGTFSPAINFNVGSDKATDINIDTCLAREEQ